MLMHQTLSKGWCDARSRLLLGLIVRPRGRLVEAQARFGTTESRSSSPAYTDPEVITLAILAQWPRFRSERDFWRFAQAHLRSYFPKLCSQSQLNRRVRSLEPDLRDFQRGVARTLRGASEVYHVLDTTLIPAIVRLRASRRGLFCGQRPPSGGAPPPDRVGLRVQGGTFCQPGGRDLHLRSGGGRLRLDRPIGDFLISSRTLTMPTWPTRALRAWSGSGVGLISMEHWWRPLPKTTPRGRGRKPTVAGHRESGRSSKGSKTNSRTSSPWSATGPRRWVGFWPAWQPRSRPTTPAGSGSTTSSDDRCATWPTFWSERLCITRLRDNPSLIHELCGVGRV